MKIKSIDFPLISEGENIGKQIKENVEIKNLDLIAVASTIVSKSQGRVVNLCNYDPSKRAKNIAKNIDEDPRFVEIVLEESEELLIENPFLLAITSFGHVAPNAGVDRSNIESGILLLPEKPQKYAKSLYSKVDSPVVITDTCGRPFRIGQVGVSIGWHGFDAIKDWRGEKDLYGKKLEITKEALADEFAAAANLLMGEGAGGKPVVCFENVPDILSKGDSNLFRPKRRDIAMKSLLKYKNDD